MSNDTDECGNGNHDMTYERASQQTFFATSALLFLASATLTARWSTSMSSIGGMTMPGGWTMSMTWMRMPGQTWLSTAASFVGMWAVMMVAMMLPSLVPALWRYRQTIGSTAATRTNWLTAAAALGYFFVWTICGAAVFPIGAALARVGMQLPELSRLVPIAVGAVVVIAGSLQFTTWKSRQLRCFREPTESNHLLPTEAVTALRHGLRLGLHCVNGCAGLTVILLVIGVMDLRVMVLVTAAITAERLAPNGARVARAVGIATVGVGLLLIVKAIAGLG
jgi:predicted metal-binding membrane protein